ncbi:MAG: TolC family protein [Kiritimatiellia bacterium]
MNLSFAHLLMPCALAIGLAGCVTAPTPSNTHTPWEPPSGSSADKRVWNELRQRQDDFSKPLPLAELTDLALRHNATTRQAWHNARAASAQVDKAQGMFMPALTANAGVDYSGVSASPAAFDSQKLRYGPGLQLNYLLINFGGGRAAAVEQALQTVYAANYAFNLAIQDALLSVETAYFNCISAQAGVEAALANVMDAKKALEAAQARNTAGMATALDVLQAQAAYDQSLYNQAAARGQWQVSRGALALAAGLPADTPLVPAPTTAALPESLGTNDVRRMIDEAIARRPDIAVLRADLAARQAAILVAHASSWPNLYLNANLNHTFNQSLDGSPSQARREWAYGAGLNVQWTFFDGWQTESEIRIAQEQAQAAAKRLEQAELGASADVWTRFQSYETALQKHAFSVAFCKSAEAARNLANEAYRAGLKTVLDLLTADAQLASARSQQVAARQEVFTALANLSYATGRLQATATPLRPVVVSPMQKDQAP